MSSNEGTISACMVIFHEEKVIERCLKSIHKVVDEIIIVHDGECNDKTLEICKKYTDKIYIRPHLGEAELHRVFTIEKATSEWVMYLDADEFLSPDLAQSLPELAKDKECDAFEFIWPIWDGNKALTKNWPWRPAMFRKDKLYYLGFPHEPFKTYGRTKKIPKIINHQPTYNNYTFQNFRKKWLKWANIHAEHMLVPFDEIPKYNYPDSDWGSKFIFARDHAYLFPFIGLYTFINNLLSGSWKEGYIAWKSSLMWGLYNSALYYKVWRLQKNAKSSQR